MEFVPILVIMATVKKIVDFVRFANARDWNGIATQLLAWLAGFGAVALAAHTPWAAGLDFGGVRLAALGVAAQLLAGIAVGSAASAVLNDIPDAVDPTRAGGAPPLVDGPRRPD